MPLKRNRILAACAALILITATALGQMNTGTIQGSVTDPSGSVIPGAQLRATDTDTGQTLMTASNESGLFVFALLQIGHHKVEVTAPGFKSTVRNDLSLLAGQAIALNLQLQVGAVSQTVVISGEPPALNTANAAQIGTISVDLSVCRPSPDQDWTDLVLQGNGLNT